MNINYMIIQARTQVNESLQNLIGKENMDKKIVVSQLKRLEEKTSEAADDISAA